MANEIKTGTFTGTGAQTFVSLGFIPTYVKVINITDGTTIDEWFDSMTAATSIQTNTAATATRAAPNGISPYGGSDTTAEGFSVGAGISVAGKTLAYLAQRDASD